MAKFPTLTAPFLLKSFENLPSHTTTRSVASFMSSCSVAKAKLCLPEKKTSRGHENLSGFCRSTTVSGAGEDAMGNVIFKLIFFPCFSAFIPLI